jgi:hypothetical protein
VSTRKPPLGREVTVPASAFSGSMFGSKYRSVAVSYQQKAS